MLWEEFNKNLRNVLKIKQLRAVSATITPIEPKQLFLPRVYKKKNPAFMLESNGDGLMPKV